MFARISAITLKLGAIPALVSEPRDRSARKRGQVVVCHGLAASKELQRPELERLAQAGFTAWAIDAPHHGERDDGKLKHLDTLAPLDRHLFFLKVIQQWAEELERIVEFFHEEKSEPVALAGVSMGGYAVYASMLRQRKPDVLIPIIASPSWQGSNDIDVPADILAGDPLHHPECFSPTPLLAITAGKDETVAPGPNNDLLDALRPRYTSHPERLKLRCFENSPHMLHPADWDETWHEVIRWLDLHLAPSA